MIRVPRNEWHRLEVPTPEELVPELTVSVVVPAHGSSMNLRRCLVSLAAQRYPLDLVQVVVVDDASDPPLEIPDRVGQLTIARHRHEPHGTFGAGRARVTGADAADGEIIVFLDADIVAPPRFLAAHARWHHVVDHAVVTSRIGFAPFDELEPSALATLLADGDLEEFGRAREGEGQAWRDKQFDRNRDLTVDAPDLFRTTVGAITSVRRHLYRVAGGYRIVGVRGVEDTEFGYRLHTNGGLFVLDRTHRLWHQGLRSFDAGRREEILATRQQYVEALIPVRGFRQRPPTTPGAVPRALVELDEGAGLTDALPSDLMIASEADALAPIDVAAVPATVRVEAGVRATASSIEALLERLWSPDLHGAVHAVDADGRVLASARSRRAEARARLLGATQTDEIGALAAETFGERWVDGHELGLARIGAIGTERESAETTPTPSDPTGAEPTSQPTTTSCDLVYVTDLRFPGGTTSSLVQEVRTAVEAGYRVGLLHLSNRALGSGAVPAAAIDTLLADDRVVHLLPGEATRCRLVIVKHPMVFAEPIGGTLPIETEQVIVTVGQVPGHADGTVYYDPAEIDTHIAGAFGLRARWAPVSPAVRDALAGHGVDLTDDHWFEVIDPADWPVRPDRPVDPQRVILGRHGRPDPLKWPAGATNIRRAYPDDPRFEVRILGAPPELAELAEGIPENWRVLEFGSRPVGEFLTELDVFVYHHHPDLVEAFGRTILEALTSGVPCIVGPHFEPLFGDACLYAEAEDTIEVIDRLASDPGAYRTLIEHGRRAVARRFSTTAHLDRLGELVGPPGDLPVSRAPGRHDLVTARQDTDRPVTLVSALSMSAQQIDRLVVHLDAQRRLGIGFRPVVVVDAGVRSSFAETLGIEVRNIRSRRSHDPAVGPWEHTVMNRLRRLAVHYGAASVVPGDPLRPEAALALGTWPVGDRSRALGGEPDVDLDDDHLEDEPGDPDHDPDPSRA